MSDAILETCWFYWQALMNCLLLQGTIDCNQGCITCGILGHQSPQAHFMFEMKSTQQTLLKTSEVPGKARNKTPLFCKVLAWNLFGKFSFNPCLRITFHQRHNRLSTECELITQPLCCQTQSWSGPMRASVT